MDQNSNIRDNSKLNQCNGNKAMKLLNKYLFVLLLHKFFYSCINFLQKCICQYEKM